MSAGGGERKNYLLGILLDEEDRGVFREANFSGLCIFLVFTLGVLYLGSSS